MNTVLLAKFNSLIEKYGGRDKLSDALEKELLKGNPNRRCEPNRESSYYYNKTELDFISDKYNNHTAEWIASELNRPANGVRTKIHRLQQKRILKKAI